MFPHGRNIAITGGNFAVNNVGNSGNLAFERLMKASAPSAFHNSGTRSDPPKCHPNTRVAVLEYLMGWIFGHNDPEVLILWLYGPAGAGKSAILQTIAERCFERKVLLATFFFGRSDPSRNTSKPLVATIAYQIATIIPEVKPRIESIIERDPLIFDKSIATQLQSLIIEPLKDLAASGCFNDPSSCARLLILIDGLDECTDPRMQSMILTALANALCHEKLPLNLLIASRPEQHITLTFDTPPFAGLWRSLVLDDAYRPDEDIRLFLEDSFRNIKTMHPHRRLIPEAWPASSDVDKLVEKSSGQFIYSSVVVKYVSAPIDRPPRRLDVIMGLRPARGDFPFAELDVLYMYVLGSCADLDTILSILGLVISEITSEIDDIEVYLDLETGDVEIVLSPLASIIEIQSDSECIKLRHASFGDFLVDISRSGPFHINTLSVKERFISNCISKLMDPYSITHYGRAKHWRRLLRILTCPFNRSFHDVPLTATVESALRGFSLPRFWSIWSTEPARKGDYSLVVLLNRFLNFLSGCQEHQKWTVGFDPRSSGFSTIYATHLSSFEPIIQTEVLKYYQNVELTSLALVSILANSYYSDNNSTSHNALPYYRDPSWKLLPLTRNSEKFDRNNLCLEHPFGRTILAVHYQYLFTGIWPNGNKYAQVALRILEYLCDHPPHPIPYQQRQTSNAHFRHTYTLTVASRSSHSRLSHKIVKMRMTDNNFLRKRREEKHRHGVALSTPDSWHSHPKIDNHLVMQSSCEFRLSLLPDILERLPYFSELADFMRKHGKNIIFMPKKTRKAIYAMHKYLDRSDEGAKMVE